MNAADAGAAWSAWTSVTKVVVSPAPRARYVRVPIPYTIAPDADGAYPDLRVVDGHGNEIAYAIDPQRTAPEARTIALIDRGFVPGRWTQAVLDLGTGGALTETIRLDVDDAARPTYFEHVVVEASDDRTTWRIVRDDAIVYRVAQDNGRGNQTIAFPAMRSRWLRVRVLDPRVAFPLTGGHIDSSQRTESALVPVPRAMTVERDTPHRSVFTLVSPNPIRPAAVAFIDAGGSFARRASVESSDDGKNWTPAGGGEIARFAEGGAQTSFAFPERTAPRWRVIVENGDDRPVAGLRPTLLARRHDVVFSAMPGATYVLASGNPAATTPAYDLGERLAHASWQAQRVKTEPTVTNASYRDARPVGERFPWLLSIALVFVAAVLGFVALRTVRAAAPE